MLEMRMSEQALLKSYPAQAIAIVGLAARFPDARNLDDFWRNVRDGVELLETLGDAELDAAGVPGQCEEQPSVRPQGAPRSKAPCCSTPVFLDCRPARRKSSIRSIGFFWNARGRRWSTRATPPA